MSHNDLTNLCYEHNAPSHSLSRTFFTTFNLQSSASSFSKLPRWSGKWPTSSYDYSEDTYPLVKVGKPHVKSIFPEYELDEIFDSSSLKSTAIVKKDTDVWSTIAITPPQRSLSSGTLGSQTVAVVAEDRSRSLTIDKIGQNGSIAKKQKDRKKHNSSTISRKAKEFFSSMKRRLVRTTKPVVKRDYVGSMIDIPMEESEMTEGRDGEHTVVDAEGMRNRGDTVVDVSANPIEIDHSLDGKGDGVSATIGDSWTDDGIVVRRKNAGDISGIAKEKPGDIPIVAKENVEGIIVAKKNMIESKSGIIALLETTISPSHEK